MNKRWIFIVGFTFCMLLLAILWQDASACWKAVSSTTYCSQADSCKGTGPYTKRDYQGGNWCACDASGGSLPWCTYIYIGGTCFDSYQCPTSSCKYNCEWKNEQKNRSCFYPTP